MEQQPEIKARALTVQEAAKYIGVRESTIYKLSKEGKIALLKIGRRTVVEVTNLDAFMDTLSGKKAA